MGQAAASETKLHRSQVQRVAILALSSVQVLVTLLPSLGVGTSIGDRSDSVRTAITPAGWAFSIWGLLYTGSVIYAVYQFLPGQKANRLLASIGWASAGAFLGNAAWALFTQFVDLNAVSVLIIAFTLACLLVCYRHIADLPRDFSSGEQFMVVLPLSALAAWLTAATIVNIAASLNYHGVSFGDLNSIVGALVVGIGGIIATATIWTGRGNPWYAAVFLWALAGIFSASKGRSDEIAFAAIAAAILVICVTALRLSSAGQRERWIGAPAD